MTPPRGVPCCEAGMVQGLPGTRHTWVPGGTRPRRRVLCAAASGHYATEADTVHHAKVWHYSVTLLGIEPWTPFSRRNASPNRIGRVAPHVDQDVIYFLPEII